MSIRRRELDERPGAPLPVVTDARGNVIGHAIPVHSSPVFTSTAQAELHALRRAQVQGGTVAKASAPVGKPAGNRVDVALERALCAAACDGNVEVVAVLVDAGVASREVANPPLAAAAIGRQCDTARQLVAAGCNTAEAVEFLKERGEVESANWLARV